MAKIQPAVKTLRFVLEGNIPNENQTYYLDLSQVTSICNRRFMRQGKVWAVGAFKFVYPTDYVGSFTVTRLPETWCVSNSWHKTYAAWKRQQDAAVSAAGAQSTVATYRDFKIHMDVGHVNATFLNNLIPIDSELNPFSIGEWEASQIVIPNAAGVVGDTSEYFLHMVGPDVALSTLGMVKNYADSRSYPQSPSPDTPNPETSYFSEMFNVGMDDVEVIENATDRNDDLPYHQTEYPGSGANAPALQIVDTIVSGRGYVSTLKGDAFPCGLVKIVVGTEVIYGSQPNTIELLVSLIPGPDRGYLTQPMQDM